MEHFDLTAAIIFGIATLQGVLTIINLIFNKRGSRIANGLLIAMLACITLIIFQNFIVFSGYYKKAPFLIFSFYSLNGLKAPLLFLYVVFLLNPKRKFKWVDLCHSALFFYLLFEQRNFLLIKPEYKVLTVDYIYYGEGRLNIASLFQVIMLRLVPVIYTIVALRLINTKLQELKNWSSDTNLQYISKFKNTAILALFVSIAFLILSTVSVIFEIPIGQYEVFHHILNTLIVVVIAMVAMQQPDRLIFTLETKAKPLKVHCTHKIAIDGLKKLMRTSQPYLNPSFKLYDLAKLSDTQPHVLSDQINQELKMNFYEFVNQYRVEEFKERVASEKYHHLTLLAIALDVGFNSKSSFNRIFKKQTGITPSQFKASLKKQVPNPIKQVSTS